MKKEMIRSTRTRRALIEAFRVLANQKEYDKITVREIAELAEVNRNSFYNYFKNIDDLLHDIVYERIYNCYYQVNTGTWHSYEQSKLELIDFFEINREFLADVFWNQQGMSAMYFYELCLDLLQQAEASGLSHADKTMQIFLAGGVSKLFTEWLFHQKEIAPKQFIEGLYDTYGKNFLEMLQ